MKHILTIFVAVTLCAACAKNPPEISPNEYASESRGKYSPDDIRQDIDPAFDGKTSEYKTEVVSEITPRPGLSLAELLDVALGNSSSTRYAWANARAAAAVWGKSRSEYYPTLDGEIDGVMGRIREPAFQGGRSYISTGLTLNYLLLDFGGREARVEAARQALLAANWTHDQSIQDLLRDVPQAYYAFLGDKALITAAEENLRDAKTTLNATEAKHKSGVVTIADVLQARSGKSQADADLAARIGSAKVSKGNLATVIGWPANAPFDIAKEQDEIPTKKVLMDVNKLIEEAKGNRPDIGAAQSLVKQKEAELHDAKALPFPKLSLGGSLEYQRFRNDDSTAMYGGLGLKIPLFAGFSMENSLRQARAELEAARAELEFRHDDVIKEVWNAYYNFNTVTQQYKAFKELLKSATQSYDASLARYKSGVAQIVELLNAQNTLASARAQLINSRMALYSTYAELMHAVGRRLEKMNDNKNVHVGE